MSEKLFGKSRIKILVHGWYNQSNLGDDCFINAFKALFPSFDFTFCDHITVSRLYNIDAIFFGGGSFLCEPLSADADALPEIIKHKIFYIGVGAETEIHTDHLKLLSIAELIAIRSPEHKEKIKQINEDVIVIPDLVYSLSPCKSNTKWNDSVLIIPNIAVVPSWNEPHWKHAAWEYFKNEFAQFVDELIVNNYKVKFFPMCNNNELNDVSAAIEIINRMANRNYSMILNKCNDFYDATYLISQYQTVITQRYHGIVLSDTLGIPNMSIYHHDKLKNYSGINVPYYNLSKDMLWKNFNKTIYAKDQAILPIYQDIFKVLIKRVEYALCSNQKQ